MADVMSIQQLAAFPVFTIASVTLGAWLKAVYKNRLLYTLPSPSEVSQTSAAAAPLGCYLWSVASLSSINMRNPVLISPATILVPVVLALPAILTSFFTSVMGHFLFLMFIPGSNLGRWTPASIITLSATLIVTCLVSLRAEFFVLSDWSGK